MKKHVPYHIGIIPDGNRRWAQSQGMEKKAGYEFGLEPGLKVLHAAKDAGVKEITYYGFTTDNCKRPKEQYEAFKNACGSGKGVLCPIFAAFSGHFDPCCCR